MQVNDDGSHTFTPETVESDNAEFTYRVSDGTKKHLKPLHIKNQQQREGSGSVQNLKVKWTSKKGVYEVLQKLVEG
jgi:hypothetical protein